MLFHFMVFKCVNYFVVAKYNWPDYVIASFPVPNEIKITAKMVYLVTGCLVPCG